MEKEIAVNKMTAEEVILMRHMIEAKISTQSLNDNAFREHLIKDPKSVLSKELGMEFPENFEVVVHEENDKTVHIVLPSNPSSSSELSDDELDTVAGGFWQLLWEIPKEMVSDYLKNAAKETFMPVLKKEIIDPARKKIGI